MADFHWGTEFGQDKRSQVVAGAASTATLDVEVRVTYDATATNKANVIIALDNIKRAIVDGAWPPA